jgi:oxygen-independent coproporphyrinogen III oxidase
VPALGLYVHVPFCRSICRYCNFNRGLFDRELKERYVRAVTAEIRSGPGRVGLPAAPEADTIYFGGGTPSLLDPEDLGAIVQACAGTFAVPADVEVTLEANPETVTAASLESLRDMGVTRLSLGVQSFRDDELRRLGRVHDAARARQAVADARKAGFDNLSLDLMMCLPAQTTHEWMESVRAAVALEPEHLSLYILELYPNAPLHEDMARAGWLQPPDDDAAEMYEAAMASLERHGYRQYEISNVARPGRESRHNLKYWRDGEWLGFGPGAHSTAAGRRWQNLPATAEWASRVEAGEAIDIERRVLTHEERWQEAMITGLRLAEGVDLGAFRADYGVDISDRYAEELDRFEEAGAVVREAGRLRLTRRGMLVANEILRVFI